MSRARELSRLGNPNIISADSSFNVGFGTANPKEKVNVVGVVSATSFFGDGSGLDGIASAGIGTALSDDKTKALNTIYFTNDEVVVTNNSTVNPPDSGHIAYTQAPTVVIENTKELIISDGDDLLVDVLGISTGTNVDFAARGNGVFDNIYVDNIESSGGQTAVNFPKGLVSSGVATFTSDVSIGGTLTYEDVKNIDSVGLITARTGIKVSAGGIEVAGGGIDVVGDIGLGAGKQTGTAGQLLTSGGAGADASWADAAGGAEYAGISSGAITAGRGVIVADDGKLIGVTGTAAIKGTQTTVTGAGSGIWPALTYDTTNNKYVYYYNDGTTGKAVVGTLSGTTITWGSPVTFHTQSTNVVIYGACYDSANNKCVVLFQDASDNNYGKVCSGTVSGNSITFGSIVPIGGSTAMTHGAIVYCSGTGNYAVLYQSDGGGAKSTIGKNSGTNSSTWSSLLSLPTNPRPIATRGCWDSTANKIIFAYGNSDETERGEIIAGTIASDQVTWGNPQVFDTSRTDTQDNVVHDPSTGKNLIVWREGSNGTGYYTLCRTATLSGTTFSFGTGTYAASRNNVGSLIATRRCAVSYDASANKFLIIYFDQSATDTYSVVATLTGDVVSFSSPTYRFSTIDGSQDYLMTIVYDPDLQRNVCAIKGTGVMYYVEAIRSSNVTSDNYVGISQASYTNGQTATISITGSVNEAVSGLTPANKYYVVADGTLSTTADSGNINGGIALAANKLLIRGW